MSGSSSVVNKRFRLVVPHVDPDNMEFGADEVFYIPSTTFFLDSKQWRGLLGLWRAMNDAFNLLLDMCEEDWLYAKDVEQALDLVERRRDNKFRAVDQSIEEYQQSLDIVKDALLEARKYNTCVEFLF